MVTVEEKVNCVLYLAKLKSVIASKGAQYSKSKLHEHAYKIHKVAVLWEERET